MQNDRDQVLHPIGQLQQPADRGNDVGDARRSWLILGGSTGCCSSSFRIRPTSARAVSAGAPPSWRIPSSNCRSRSSNRARSSPAPGLVELDGTGLVSGGHGPVERALADVEARVGESLALDIVGAVTRIVGWIGHRTLLRCTGLRLGTLLRRANCWAVAPAPKAAGPLNVADPMIPPLFMIVMALFA